MRTKYFMPYWEDFLDPDYDFIKDRYSRKRKRKAYYHDKLAHEISETKLYDGILVSLAVFGRKIRLNGSHKSYLIREYPSIKEYLRIAPNMDLEVFGDCGAFSYVSQRSPPGFYSSENVARLYHTLGFDYGVSVDHLIVKYYYKERKDGTKVKHVMKDWEKWERLRISRENAWEFIDIHKEYNYSFTPVAAIQGWTAGTYLNSVKDAVNAGYDYVAIGGLVQYNTKTIKEFLTKIRSKYPSLRIHVFGVQRKELIPLFNKLNVTSFDSASFFRKAWLRSGENYFSNGKGWYTAIRIPYSWYWKTKQIAESFAISMKKVRKLEKQALKALRDYDAGKLDLETTLNRIMEYDSLFIRSSESETRFKERYERTLKDKPWKSCTCSFCQKIGIDIIIFRGTNRNKRRGFHNIWSFYQMLIRSKPRELVNDRV